MNDANKTNDTNKMNCANKTNDTNKMNDINKMNGIKKINDANKKYYKSVYDKVHASDDLRERVLNMRGKHLEEDQRKRARQNKGSKSHRMAWRAAAAAVILAVVVPSGVYAATRQLGIGEFLNNPLTKEAKGLIERDIVQTKNGDEEKEMPVDFKVKEALCDCGYVNIVLEAKLKETGRYLMFPAFGTTLPSDPVLNLGIKEEKTIDEYAKSKGLTLLYIDCEFADSSEFPYPQSACTLDYALEDDGTMSIYISSEKKGDDKNLNVAVECMAGGYGTTLNFKLHDKSQSEKFFYAANEKIVLDDVKATVKKVTVEKSDVYTYVNIYYRYKGKTEDEIENDGLFFRIKDSIGEERGGRWDQVSFDGTGGRSEGDGLYSCRLVYDSSIELPEKFVLEAYDIRNAEKGIIFGEFELSKVKK